MSTPFLTPAVDSSIESLPPYPVRRFTIDEYFKLVDVGLLDENANCELLEGWIVPKTVKNPLHDGTVDIVLKVLGGLLPSGWYPRVQNVLQTVTSAPEPDFAVTRGKPGNFTNRHPQGTDVGLVIEVADSSLEIDRRKALIYAAAGVPAYWIINLQDRCLEVFETGQPPRVLHAGDEIDLTLDGVLVARIGCARLLPDGPGQK